VKIFTCVKAKVKALTIVLAICAGAACVKGQTSAAVNGAYRVAGTAVDARTGRALARTEVSIDLIEGKNVRETYATGADGTFVFEGLAAGRYQLSAKRRGYVSQSYKGHREYFTAIVVGPGLKSEDVRFAMTAGGSIVGHVLDERGDPVGRGRVLLMHEVSTGRGQRLTRDHWTELNDLGAYRFDHLEPGAYVVAVSARPWYAEPGVITATGPAGELPPGDVDTGVAYPVTFYPGAMDAETAGRITLTEGESARADVSLSPVAALSVSVKNYEPNERVQLISAAQYIADGITEQVQAPATVGQDTITIEGLAPGRVDISWRSGTGKNMQENLTSVNLSGRDFDSSMPTVIRGVLEGAGGMKVAGTTVKLAFGNTGGKSYSATVGAKGEFEFHEELLSGLHSIEMPQFADAVLGIRAKGADFVGDFMQVHPGREIELKISAGVAGRVRGRVVKNGAGAEGSFVALVPEGFEDANNLIRVGESDSSGAFEMERVVPGRYVLIALEDGWDGDWRGAEFLGRFVAGGEKIEIGAGAVVTAGEIEAVK
jgi:hypothetical protein